MCRGPSLRKHLFPSLGIPSHSPYPRAGPSLLIPWLDPH